ncbi:unnamed protein product, partial [Sphenostylis stenocarpa]
MKEKEKLTVILLLNLRFVAIGRRLLQCTGLLENPTGTQHVTFREEKKCDCGAIFYIHKCVNKNNFQKISMANLMKERGICWHTDTQ